jgi:hypothetical protein
MIRALAIRPGRSPSAKKAGDDAERDAADEGDRDRNQRDGQVDPRRGENPGKNVEAGNPRIKL